MISCTYGKVTTHQHSLPDLALRISPVCRVGHMELILLTGVLLNFAGAVNLLVSAIAATASEPIASVPDDYLQLKLFTGGTAAVFGCLYLYLYLHPSFVIPFLIFGAALKTWAFLLSLVLYARRRLSRRAFVGFGVTNAVVAVLFWFYIISLLI